MIENNEQPLVENHQSLSVNNVEKKGEDMSTSGSLLGKFKDVESLKNAYEMLQKEFTKKSQKLSEYEKSDNFAKNNSTEQKETYLQDNAELQNAEPLFLKQDWSLTAQEFIKNKPEAAKYAKEIFAMLTKDKVMATMPNSLEIAYNKILAAKYRPEESIIDDENFIENYVLNNEKVKNKILNNYLSTFQKNKVPTVMSTTKGSGVGLTPQVKPKSLEEAKKLMELMFK